MKIKRIFVMLLACLCICSNMVMAAEDDHVTTLTYEVGTSYKWSAPDDITFADNIDTESKPGTVTVTENVIAGNETLKISIASDAIFQIESAEHSTRNYKVLKDSDELSAGSLVLEVPSGTGEATQDLHFVLQGVVSGNTSQIAGTYTGTLNFVAKVTGEYTINYILNGGTNNPSNPTGYTMNEGDVAIYEPSKEFFTFGGWYDNPEFTGSEITVLPNGTSGTVNLYAKWTADEFVISYNLNGGTNDSSNPAKYNINSSAIVLGSPSKPGYIFVGWTGSNGETPSTNVTILSGSTGNKEYTANWQAESYSISYNLDGGTNNPANPSTYTVEDLPLTLQAPTKDGYAFLGWHDGTNYVTGIPAGTTGDKTLTAKWERLKIYKLVDDADSNGEVSKGDIISLNNVDMDGDSTDDKYRVLQTNGTEVKLITLYSYDYQTVTGETFGNRLDVYYNNLPENIKTRIFAKNLTKTRFKSATSDSYDFSINNGSTTRYYSIDSTINTASDYYSYQIDIAEIIEYFGVKNLNATDINKLISNNDESPYDIYLRSQTWYELFGRGDWVGVSYNASFDKNNLHDNHGGDPELTNIVEFVIDLG